VSINTEVQKPDGNSIVWLFQLDVQGTIYYFTSSAFETTAVLFDGNSYTPMPIEAGGFEWTGNGPIPTPTIKLSNTTQFFNALIADYNDLLGCKVTRIRTFRRYLDGEVDADPTATFPLDIYYIDRKSGQNKYFVEFELTSIMDQRGRKIPGRQILRDVCTYVYRRWDADAGAFVASPVRACPYNGASMFKYDDTVTLDETEDACGQRLTSCRKRFGSVLPFAGFPMCSRDRRLL